MAQPLKKQKLKKAAKEKAVVTNLEGLALSKERSEIHVMDKDFPYLDCIDKELMIPALLKHLEGDDENLAAKFQWAGRAMLKSATLLRYSEPVITSDVEAKEEVRVLKEKLSLLRDEKSVLEKAKQDKINGLKEVLESKDKQLEDSRSRVSKLERAALSLLKLLPERGTR